MGEFLCVEVEKTSRTVMFSGEEKVACGAGLGIAFRRTPGFGTRTGQNRMPARFAGFAVAAHARQGMVIEAVQARRRLTVGSLRRADQVAIQRHACLWALCGGWGCFVETVGDRRVVLAGLRNRLAAAAVKGSHGAGARNGILRCRPIEPHPVKSQARGRRASPVQAIVRPHQTLHVPPDFAAPRAVSALYTRQGSEPLAEWLWFNCKLAY